MARLSFGDCVADFDAREVLRAGRAVHLEPRALRLLQLLIAARPRALSKQELHEALWPRTFVTGRSLARLAADLRRGLGDCTKPPKFIRTVHGYGYGFCAEPVLPPVRRGVERRVAKNPTNRGASTLDLAREHEAVRSHLTGESATSPAAIAVRAPRHPPVALLAVAASILLALGWVAGRSTGTDTRC